MEGRNHEREGPDKDSSSQNNGFVIFHHGGHFVKGPPYVYKGGGRSIIPVNSSLLSPSWLMNVIAKELKYPTIEVKSVYFQQHGATLPKWLKKLGGENSTREMRRIVEEEGWIEVFIDHDIIVLIIEPPLLGWVGFSEQASDENVESSEDSDYEEEGNDDSSEDADYEEEVNDYSSDLHDGSSEVADHLDDLGDGKEAKKKERVRRYKTLHVGGVYKKKTSPYKQSTRTREPGPSTQADNDEREFEEMFGPADLYEDSEKEGDEDQEEWFVHPKTPKIPKKKRVYYDPDAKVPNIAMGVLFYDHNEFKNGVKKHAVIHGCNTKHVKNEKTKQSFKAIGGRCKWEVYASWDRDEKGIMVKSLQPIHTCSRTGVIDILDSKWVASEFWKQVSENPCTKVSDMVKKLKEDKGLDISWEKCRRAKKKILTVLAGNYIEQFAQLEGYAHYVLSLNKENTVKLNFTLGANCERTFQRIYISYGVIKHGWKKGCRHVIGVDGCFLKGAAKGILVTAVGRDGNDQMYPIAWAVVESENSESWGWFFECLQYDLDLGNGRGYLIISDQHRTIINARERVLPSAEQRFCARHVHGCWAKRHGGSNDLRILWWACAKSTFKEEWQEKMAKLRESTEEGYQEMLTLPAKFWSRAFVETFSMCENVDNNMCETFNSKILHERCLPIISMLRGLELYCLEKRRDMYRGLEKWEGDISPSAQSMLDLAIDKAKNNTKVVHNGYYWFRVEDEKYVHTCNFREKDCSCRVWQMTGIPCQHVVCAADSMGWDLEQFVSNYFKKEAYIAAWKTPLEFSRGPEMWRGFEGPPIPPPPIKTVIGRPKKNRRKAKGELKKVKKGEKEKMSRANKPVTCSLCKMEGHNKRTCHRYRTEPSYQAPPSQPSQMNQSQRSSVLSQGASSQNRKRNFAMGSDGVTQGNRSKTTTSPQSKKGKGKMA